MPAEPKPKGNAAQGIIQLIIIAAALYAIYVGMKGCN